MSNILQIEENEKNLPVICLYGYSPGIRERFVRLNSKKFRIIIVGNRKPSYLQDFPEVYFLTYKNATLLPKLQEAVDYAVVFLSDEECVKNLAPLVDKANKDKTQTLAVLSPQTIVKDVKNITHVKSFSNLRYCLLGEIISPEVKNTSNLSKIIENAILKQEIRLSGEEQDSVYCITLDDALVGIQRLLFGNFRRNVFHALFYKSPQTILEGVHQIAKVEPEVKLFFSDTSVPSKMITRDMLRKEILHSTNMELSLVDSLEGFDKSIEKFFSHRKDFQAAFLSRTRKHKIKKKTTPVLKALKLSAISFLAGIFLFIFLNLTFFGIGMLYLQKSLHNIGNSNFDAAVSDARISNVFLSIIKPTIELSFDAISSIDKQGQTQQTYRLLRKAGELSEIGGATVSNILEKTNITESELLSSIASFSFIYQEGQRIHSKNQSSTLGRELKDTYSKLLSLSQVLPVVLGYEGEKNYLLLFQNNEELRPTGGFIGAVGDLTLKEGRIANFQLHDVYELDSKLENHIEPPFAVRRHLEEHLFLRDSNFFLNFQESASRSALIYNLETERKPDAVVAINLEVLKKTLEISGPITLPTYNVTVNNETISQYLQSTDQDNNFPGSFKKTDVLSAIINQIIQRSEKDPKFNVDVVKLFPQLLEDKNILISFSDNTIQKVFSAIGYGGSYSDPRPKNSKVIQDYLYINESNIGLNDINSLISRSVSYRGQIGQEAVFSEATLSLTNASKSEDYKAYITFVVPNNSQLQSVSINGINQNIDQAITDPAVFTLDDFIAPEGLETEQYIINNLTHIAFVVTAARDSKTDIMVKYNNGATIPLTNLSKYSLLVIKQPGVTDFDLNATYEYPEGYTPNKANATSYASNFFEKKISIKGDTLIDFELQKK